MSVAQEISIVWFKRDLRLRDHTPIANAILAGQPIVLLYVFEPMLLNDAHYDERHWRFIWQSLEDLNQQLKAFNTSIYIVEDDAISALECLWQNHTISTLYSYEEIGLLNTFKRDLKLKKWCSERHIKWHEYPQGGVIRGALTREAWDKNWHSVMRAELAACPLEKATFVAVPRDSLTLPAHFAMPAANFQRGGPTWAYRTLNSFFASRGQNYARFISKPLLARKSCSRMSPYLAWGNISLREMYQILLAHWSTPGWRRALSALSSRLHWHCHFIQKFESEHQMQFRCINQAFDDFEYTPEPQQSDYLLAWQEARTGFPLVDACMRCVTATGYLNFRMRAMLVSFLCHHLLLDWRLGVEHLARLFLDFEPGIHYPQFQMQAGVTGTNTIRIYNPVKQSVEHDSEGQFIKKWLPELQNVPNELVHTPWLLSAMEQVLYGVTIGKDYPTALINLEIAAKQAREKLWSFRSHPNAVAEKSRIVAKHVRARKPKTYPSKGPKKPTNTKDSPQGNLF
jgi:deoxyribodipyrimidine photo-lyase